MLTLIVVLLAIIVLILLCKFWPRLMILVFIIGFVCVMEVMDRVHTATPTATTTTQQQQRPPQPRTPSSRGPLY
jgi:hypothetical protein